MSPSSAEPAEGERDLAETRTYLGKVVTELRKREESLHRLVEEIARLEFLLERGGWDRGPTSALSLMLHESYKKVVREDLRKKKLRPLPHCRMSNGRSSAAGKLKQSSLNSSVR